MSTVTEIQTLQAVLNDANPQNLAAAIQKIKLGTMFAPVDTGDVTQAAATDMVLPEGGKALVVQWVELVTNVGNAGFAMVGPSDATPVDPSGAGAADGMVALSQDGTTLTAASNVTVFRVLYVPRPYTDLTATFA